MTELLVYKVSRVVDVLPESSPPLEYPWEVVVMT